MPPPAFAYGDAAYKAVAAGRRHACAVDAMGGLVCWGDGNPAAAKDSSRGRLPSPSTSKRGVRLPSRGAAGQRG
ncbi:hypothetical protein QYE76_045330 [Lolium multiflorum]|uniref:Uncharacterized protein n=1 Tax=Lolium multiflorum TaxID=4521 RepID=A0AAD8RLK4_LOLMU|nr:hypothetical protein QYE76_001548 [Lolium multiflorum]KAK1631471.1 hypothetical protein QYE76_005786 [Lolium multiflorum]KAK1684482.1 hypothetical protein QYE76_045330 [Lolium multiflorum]